MALEYYEKIFPSVYERGYTILAASPPTAPLSVFGSHTYRYDYGNFLKGYRNPSWRDQIINLRDATTPLVARKRSVLSRPATMTYDDFRPTASRVKGIMEAPLDVDPFPLDLASSTSEESYAKAYKLVSKRSFKTFTFLGELRETVHLLRNPALALRKEISAYTKRIRKLRLGMDRDRQTVGAFRRAASDSWLEASFGWRPLIGDISDATRTISSLAINTRGVPFHVTSKQTKIRPLSGWSELAGGGVSCMYRSSAIFEATSRISGSIREEGGVSGLPARFALFPFDFVPAAWELLPWSFLIDYFTNIGNIFDAVAVGSRTGYVYLNETTRQIVNTSYEFRVTPQGYIPGSVYPSYYTIVEDKPGYAKCRSKTVARSSLAYIPIPDFQLSFTLGSSKILNIGALIAGRRSDSQYRVRRP